MGAIGIGCCLFLFPTNSQAQQNKAFQQKIEALKSSPQTVPQAVQVTTPKINKEAFQKHKAAQVKMTGQKLSKAKLKAVYEKMLTDPKKSDAQKAKAQQSLKNLNQ